MPIPSMNPKEIYDSIMTLQKGLSETLQDKPLSTGIYYREVQALAATYELQDYLANQLRKVSRSPKDSCTDKMDRAQAVYTAFERSLQNLYVDLHAIYDPDSSSAYPDCYCAAVDLLTPGMTFRVYFSPKEADWIQIEHIERWYFG